MRQFLQKVTFVEVLTRPTLTNFFKWKVVVYVNEKTKFCSEESGVGDKSFKQLAFSNEVKNAWASDNSFKECDFCWNFDMIDSY